MKLSVPLWQLAGEGLALCYRGATAYEAEISHNSALVLSGEPYPDLNYFLLDDQVFPEIKLCRAVEKIRLRQIPALYFIAADLKERIAETACKLGLTHACNIPVMTYTSELALYDAAGYEIEIVSNAKMLKTANRLMASAFNLPVAAVERVFGPGIIDAPGVQVFIASRNNTPLCTVQTTTAGNICGIWGMATAPDFKQKMDGKSLLQFVMSYHFLKGVKAFYLLGTEIGRPFYEDIGFQAQTEAMVWVDRECPLSNFR
jgi:hypothetical protein